MKVFWSKQNVFFFSFAWIGIKVKWCSGKVLVERRRVCSWNESER